MIRKIKIANFKCFDSLILDCSPLTMLCGMNGAGKSSVIQMMLVLRQSTTSGELQAGRLVLGGEFTDLGTGQDVLFEGAQSDMIEFSLCNGDFPDPCKLVFDYSRTSDELVVANFPSSEDRRTSIPEQWAKAPPFGGYMAYVNAERLGPRKSYSHSEVFARRAKLGVRGEFAMNYLLAQQDKLLSEDDPRCAGSSSRRLFNIVDHWLQQVTPGAHLELEAVQHADAIIAGFSFDQKGDVKSRRYRATNVGFGLSYTLPVLTALLAPPGSLCLVENPEAHLHPRGQTRLGEFAVRAALAGVQVFVETHSDHFMDGVRIAVRDGLIQPDKVAFHYFSHFGGETKVSSPQLDAEGRLSSWPKGFFDQHEENLAKLIAPRHQKNA